ncbi:MAG: murein biosynthesis integral membrane protein MurJ [Oscillospiraceae bacterium]|jgi:putative peptidoglycan lipid II flippase|nr:murein biosynthesis integral membrane protein MurJ [Oscillospiraceae bacterium]
MTAIAVVMAFMLGSKLLGFLREVALSSKFGMSYVTDAYKVAFDIPCLLLSALIAAIAAVFIPIYNERSKLGEAEKRRFVTAVLVVGLLVSAVVALITQLSLGWLVRAMLPDASDETIELTIKLSTIMMPMALFVFLFRMLGSYLQANFNFMMSAIATCFSAICVIAGIYLSNGNITVVAVWTLVGMAVEFVTLIPRTTRLGVAKFSRFTIADSGIRQLAFLMLPLLVMGVFDQMYIVFDRVVTSSIEGDISALNYAYRISTMVSSAFLLTISTVLYPSITKAADDKREFAEQFSFGVNLNMLIGIPAMAMLLILRQPVVRAVYERGAFLPSNTLTTAGCLACYSVGMVGVGLREILNRAFWAKKSMRIPMMVGVLGVILNIALDFPLYNLFGVSGVALSQSVSIFAAAAALMIILKIKYSDIGSPAMLACLRKTAVATAAMCAALLALQYLLNLDSIAYLLAAALVGLLVYIALLFVQKTSEVSMLFSFLKARGTK